jgi:hypothetical protein
MGAIMTRTLSGVALPGGAAGLSGGTMALTESIRDQFAMGLHRVFLAGLLVSVAGLVATLFLPHVHFSKPVPSGTGEQMIEAEMTNLRPEDEPIAVPD